jgi:hypothetical protein
MNNEQWDSVNDYLKDVLRHLPEKCDFCDFFSGNRLKFAAQRPAVCLNPESEHFKKPVDEEAEYKCFTNEVE